METEKHCESGVTEDLCSIPVKHEKEHFKSISFAVHQIARVDEVNV